MLVGRRLPSIPAQGAQFMGRPVISRDTRISGGVCLGGKEGREAIVVDWKTRSVPGGPVCLATLYEVAKTRATDSHGFNKQLALRAVYNTVNEQFIHRDPSSLAIFNRNLGATSDAKVHIDCYIAARTGVCRHMGLTCAAILERMVDEGLLAGKVSNDRNSIPGLGAHAWCRYTTSRGVVKILDPMQEFFGTLEESKQQSTWSYARPEERG